MMLAHELAQAARAADAAPRAHAPDSPFNRAVYVCAALCAGRSFTVYTYMEATGVSLATAKRDLQTLRRLIPTLCLSDRPSDKGGVQRFYSLARCQP